MRSVLFSLKKKKMIQEEMVFFLPLAVVISDAMAGTAAAILSLAWFRRQCT